MVHSENPLAYQVSVCDCKGTKVKGKYLVYYESWYLEGSGWTTP
jgi:hypothetical protein